MSQIIYNIALISHIAGITIMAGTTFLDFIIFRQICQTRVNEDCRIMALEDSLFNLQKFIGIGMFIILVSGLVMIYYMHEVWAQQLWFRLKMFILLLLIINGAGIRRALGKKLRKLVIKGTSVDSFTALFAKVKNDMTLVQISQLLLFIVIFILSVFKFN